MARFRKGSPQAKAYMKKLRAKRKGVTLSRRSIPKTRRKKSRRKLIKYKTRRTIPKMARRKTYKKRSYSRKKGMFGALQTPLVSGITYAFIQPVLSQFLTRFNIGIQDELVQIIGAVVLRNVTRSSIVNNYANAAIIINTASLVSGFSGKFLSGLGGVAPATTTNVIG